MMILTHALTTFPTFAVFDLPLGVRTDNGLFAIESVGAGSASLREERSRPSRMEVLTLPVR
ncbi:hypothetical protein, partial [Pseudoclavibacter helvolus]|uniref:hypothetical protein n=1 Tax=Pseudoclavibacter helvolus TaxID=255205 RepID=UPI003C7215B8